VNNSFNEFSKEDLNSNDNEYLFVDDYNFLSTQDFEQIEETNRQPEEKQFVTEKNVSAEMQTNVQQAKRAKSVAKNVTTVLALAAAGTVGFASGVVSEPESISAKINQLVATPTAIYYESVIHDWSEDEDFSVLVYNDNKQIMRVDEIYGQTERGEQQGLPSGVYFTIEIKHGDNTLDKQRIKTQEGPYLDYTAEIAEIVLADTNVEFFAVINELQEQKEFGEQIEQGNFAVEITDAQGKRMFYSRFFEPAINARAWGLKPQTSYTITITSNLVPIFSQKITTRSSEEMQSPRVVDFDYYLQNDKIYFTLQIDDPDNRWVSAFAEVYAADATGKAQVFSNDVSLEVGAINFVDISGVQKGQTLTFTLCIIQFDENSGQTEQNWVISQEIRI